MTVHVNRHGQADSRRAALRQGKLVLRLLMQEKTGPLNVTLPAPVMPVRMPVIYQRDPKMMEVE